MCYKGRGEWGHGEEAGDITPSGHTPSSKLVNENHRAACSVLQNVSSLLHLHQKGRGVGFNVVSGPNLEEWHGVGRACGAGRWGVCERHKNWGVEVERGGKRIFKKGRGEGEEAGAWRERGCILS
jgi:hypothetical protein